ncbi:MAG: hypothetical protein Q7U14_08920, partial [Lacisediminimonas sp.]|nr:hypothetical protein [Lacisediminimonas sp.]
MKPLTRTSKTLVAASILVALLAGCKKQSETSGASGTPGSTSGATSSSTLPSPSTPSATTPE